MSLNKAERTKVPNQLFRDLLGVNGLNPWDGHDSSARKQMFSNHIGQTLVVKGATERYCQTGMEREYGKYTFSVKTPGTDGIDIIKIVDRYRYQIGEEPIAFSPQRIVIYEDNKTKEIGIINLTNYCSYHQYFGFPYKKTKAFNDIVVGASVASGEILLDSPSITEDGGYKYGVECNVAFMSMPGVSEDGIVISRDVLDKFTFRTYETRIVEWGHKRFPLNLYGTLDNPKPFPDIGDRIRSDGLLMALRSYDKNMAVVEQSIHDLCEPDFIFDKLTYAAGAGGRVVDIRIHHDSQQSQMSGPVGLEVQPEKYDKSRRQFYQELLDEAARLRRNRGDSLVLTPEFHRLLVEARAVIDHDNQRIVKLYRQAPLDDWRVEFVIEYEIVPNIGNKLTDCHGGKGVICHIAEPWQMPVDEHGNRVDIVVDGNSTLNRMNIGRLFEHYTNAASRDVVKMIRENILQCKPNKHLEKELAELERTAPDTFNRAWDYLMGYYEIVSPEMYVWFTSGDYRLPRSFHLASIVNKGTFLFIPPEHESESVEIIEKLEKFYRPLYGPVTYVGNSGRRITTKNNVRVGSMYIIELEKTGDDWTAVSSGKLQHFGVLSQVTNTDKYSQPSRNQAIRALGESEVRIYVSYAGALITADILDRNNNPATHKQILHSILNAAKPTDIPLAVDRNVTPLGGARPLQLVKHILECSGVRFVYNKYQPKWDSNQYQISTAKGQI